MDLFATDLTCYSKFTEKKMKKKIIIFHQRSVQLWSKSLKYIENIGTKTIRSAKSQSQKTSAFCNLGGTV